MITIAERVLVPYPPDLVWQVLSDPVKVVDCIEGSELKQYREDGSFDARLEVKFAAIKVGFRATGSVEYQEAEKTGRLSARGGDARGSTRVAGSATFSVVPEGDGTNVGLNGEVNITGQLASLVTTGATVVVNRMTKAFTERLSETCAALAAPPPAVVTPATGTATATAVATPALPRLSAAPRRGFLRSAWTRLRLVFPGRRAFTSKGA